MSIIPGIPMGHERDEVEEFMKRIADDMARRRRREAIKKAAKAVAFGVGACIVAHVVSKGGDIFKSDE